MNLITNQNLFELKVAQHDIRTMTNCGSDSGISECAGCLASLVYLYMVLGCHLSFPLMPSLLLCSKLNLQLCICLFGVSCLLLQAAYIGSELAVVQLRLKVRIPQSG